MSIHSRFLGASIAVSMLVPLSAVPQEAPLTRTPVSATMEFGFADLMVTLIQPRHLKLYRAAASGNWELAAAENRNLRADLNRISGYIPKYLSNDVTVVVRQMFEPRLMEMDKAIAAADPKRVTAAYAKLTAGCNECHVYMEHPFIVIKVPDAVGTDAFADQDFRPRP